LLPQEQTNPLTPTLNMQAHKNLEARTPRVACLDPLSGPPVNPESPILVDRQQPFPYYGEVQVE
jgi:hypothetical protein